MIWIGFAGRMDSPPFRPCVVCGEMLTLEQAALQDHRCGPCYARKKEEDHFNSSVGRTANR